MTFLARSVIFTSFAKIIEFNTLLNYLDLQEGEKVCDLGSGYGSNDVLLSLAGAQTYAVDIDRDILGLAKNNAGRLQVNVNYCIADLNRAISFKSKSFDKAVSYCVLEHLSNPEGFLSEANRILRSKGILALSVDSFSYYKISNELANIHKEVCDVKRYYTKREVELLLNKCSFSVKKCSFIMKSPISSFLFETLLRTYFRSELYRQSLSLRLFKLLTPIVLVVCIISDGFYDDSNGGYWLTLLAVKET
jgi:2-polyprenyl-3-methyl-5-hydroxy-6-metoxy-1,4-benzoquinol methylase